MRCGDKWWKVKRRNSRYTKILTYRVCRREKIRKITTLEEGRLKQTKNKKNTQVGQLIWCKRSLTGFR